MNAAGWFPRRREQGLRHTVLGGIAALFLVLCGGAADGAVEAPSSVKVTPPRLGYVDGEVLFWRPGGGDWEPAQVNMPLAAGDALAVREGRLELQIGARSFVRAADGTQMRVVENEPSFLHLEVTQGFVTVDLRDMRRNTTVLIETPNSAITLAQDGYYRLDVDEATRLTVRRGGMATIRPGGGSVSEVATGETVEITGSNHAQVAMSAAQPFDEWDRWNYARGEEFISAPRSYAVSSDVYGVEELERHGTWRYENTYGRVWVPNSVPSGWAPYTDGRWAWDPLYGWSWVDYAPWGWAPYHYGRWVYTGGYWGWAPGPVIAAPYYSPALVAFFGVPGFSVGVTFGVPAVSWVALGWGEPLIPWWGGVGFIGNPCWWGWGGPRVVNNIVINNNTVINAKDVNFYRNFDAPGAVVGVPKDQFATHALNSARLQNISTDQLEPVRGALPVERGGGVGGGNKLDRPNLNGQQAGVASKDGVAGLRSGLQGGAADSNGGAPGNSKLGTATGFDRLRGGGAAAATNGSDKPGAPSLGSNLRRGSSGPGASGDTKIGSSFGRTRDGAPASQDGLKAGASSLGSRSLRRGDSPPAIPGGSTKPGASFGGLRRGSGSAPQANAAKLGAPSNLQRGRGDSPPSLSGSKTGSSFGGLRRSAPSGSAGNGSKPAAPSVRSGNLQRGQAPPAVPGGSKAGSSFGGLRRSAPSARNDLAAPSVRSAPSGNLQRRSSPSALSRGTTSKAPSVGSLNARRGSAPSAPSRAQSAPSRLSKPSAPAVRSGSMRRAQSPSAPRGVSKPSASQFQRSAPSRSVQRSAPSRSAQRAPSVPSGRMSAPRASTSKPSVSSPQRLSAPSRGSAPRASAPAPSANTRSFSRSMGGGGGGGFRGSSAGMARGMGGGGSGFSRSMGGGGSSFGRSMGGGGKLGR